MWNLGNLNSNLVAAIYHNPYRMISLRLRANAFRVRNFPVFLPSPSYAIHKYLVVLLLLHWNMNIISLVSANIGSLLCNAILVFIYLDSRAFGISMLHCATTTTNINTYKPTKTCIRQPLCRFGYLDDERFIAKNSNIAGFWQSSMFFRIYDNPAENIMRSKPNLKIR